MKSIKTKIHKGLKMSLNESASKIRGYNIYSVYNKGSFIAIYKSDEKTFQFSTSAKLTRHELAALNILAVMVEEENEKLNKT